MNVPGSHTYNPTCPTCRRAFYTQETRQRFCSKSCAGRARGMNPNPTVEPIERLPYHIGSENTPVPDAVLKKFARAREAAARAEALAIAPTTAVDDANADLPPLTGRRTRDGLTNGGVVTCRHGHLEGAQCGDCRRERGLVA